MRTELVSLIILLFSAICIVVNTIYLKKIYYKETKFQDEIKKHVPYVLITLVAYALISYVTIRYSVDHHWTAVLRITRMLTLFWGCYLLACTDAKEKIIPNKVILALLVIRCAYLVVEVIVAYPFFKQSLGYPLVGAAIGGGIIALAMFISRHGVGAGDVKLFLAIGFYVGSTEIISTLLYTFLISAFVGLGMLLFGKAKLKDSVPLAPFAFLGVALEFCMLVIGG